jgi:hypothetical protein
MASILKPIDISRRWTFFGGDWDEGNAPITGSSD